MCHIQAGTNECREAFGPRESFESEWHILVSAFMQIRGEQLEILLRKTLPGSFPSTASGIVSAPSWKLSSLLATLSEAQEVICLFLMKIHAISCRAPQTDRARRTAFPTNELPKN
jgi:hypothetical protein